jgi:choline dehydrogenase-like flavoprotein
LSGSLTEFVVRGAVVSSEAMSSAFQRVVGLTDEIVGSDERLREYVLATVRSYCHALGTAPMGADVRSGAVVDENGAVHGIDRLFVIDASILAAVPRVVPTLTVMMLAERLAHRLQST